MTMPSCKSSPHFPRGISLLTWRYSDGTHPSSATTHWCVLYRVYNRITLIIRLWPALNKSSPAYSEGWIVGRHQSYHLVYALRTKNMALTTTWVFWLKRLHLRTGYTSFATWTTYVPYSTHMCIKIRLYFTSECSWIEYPVGTPRPASRSLAPPYWKRWQVQHRLPWDNKYSSSPCKRSPTQNTHCPSPYIEGSQPLWPPVWPFEPIIHHNVSKFEAVVR